MYKYSIVGQIEIMAQIFSSFFSLQPLSAISHSLTVFAHHQQAKPTCLTVSCLSNFFPTGTLRSTEPTPNSIVLIDSKRKIKACHMTFYAVIQYHDFSCV